MKVIAGRYRAQFPVYSRSNGWSGFAATSFRIFSNERGSKIKEHRRWHSGGLAQPPQMLQPHQVVTRGLRYSDACKRNVGRLQFVHERAFLHT